MSADNFYVVRKHPLGGYTYVMGFASDTDEYDEQIMPEARDIDTQYKTWQEALHVGCNEYAEYGISVHPECYESKSIFKKIKKIIRID